MVKRWQKLYSVQRFNHCIRLVIPTTVNVGVPADTSDWVDRAVLLFSQYFKGGMRKTSFGFYESEKFGSVQETVFEIEAWTDDMGLQEAEAALEDFVVNILVELGQETVFLAVDNQANLLKLAGFQIQAA